MTDKNVEPIVAGGSPVRVMEGVDEHLVERRLRSESVYEGHFLQVRRDEIRLPSGKLAYREHVVHPGAVMIVPMTDDGRLIVERQHRYPLDRVLLNCPPASSIRRRPRCTAPSANCARKRATARANGLTRVACTTHLRTPTKFIDIWFARGLVPGEQQLDDGEFLEVRTMPESELFALAASGELTDAKTMVALLKLQLWRSGAWTPTWQPAE